MRMTRHRALVWMRIWYGFNAVLLLAGAAFGLYVYPSMRGDWPILIGSLGFAFLGAALLWRTIIGWKRPSDTLVPPLRRY